FKPQHALVFAPTDSTQEAHAQQRFGGRRAFDHHRFHAHDIDGTDLDAIEVYLPSLCGAAGGADHDLLADDAIVDAQPACLVFVDGHRSRTGIDEKLHRLPVDRAGDPVVATLPLGDAQLLALRFGIPRAQFATEVVVA